MAIFYDPLQPEGIPNPALGLGRYVYHDDRSKAYPFTAPAPVPCTCGCPHCCKKDSSIIASILWEPVIPALNQGSLGSCTGMSMAHLLASPSAGRAPLMLSVDERLAIDIYSGGTRLDDIPGTYPPVDTGCSGLGVMKYARSRGWVSGYRHAFSLDQVLLALQTTPMLFGLIWRRDMYSPAEDGLVSYTGTNVGGHEVVLIGCDVDSKTLMFRNSWGPNWGVSGNFRMTYADFASALADRGDATIPIW
ncbi:C1 family peptidase [Spirillospora sp. NPDC047279]|uniref:C1 family peptidase n=1 Tax=Spirillospora sp. NPDC047279 TaxID=3155478 RepID=UPI0033D01FDA